MAKKKTPTMSQEEAVNTALDYIKNLPAGTMTNEEAVLNDYYKRKNAKAKIKGTGQMMTAFGAGVGPNQQTLFNSMFAKKSTDYLKGVKNPSQLAGITKPNYVPPASNASSNTTSNTTSNTSSGTSNTAPLPTSPVTAPSYVGSSDWDDIVSHYFPKGAGNYRDGGKVKSSKPAQTYADGGLVRGGGKALRGRGRGKMV